MLPRTTVRARARPALVDGGGRDGPHAGAAATPRPPVTGVGPVCADGGACHRLGPSSVQRPSPAYRRRRRNRMGHAARARAPAADQTYAHTMAGGEALALFPDWTDDGLAGQRRCGGRWRCRALTHLWWGEVGSAGRGGGGDGLSGAGGLPPTGLSDGAVPCARGYSRGGLAHRPSRGSVSLWVARWRLRHLRGTPSPAAQVFVFLSSQARIAPSRRECWRQCGPREMSSCPLNEEKSTSSTASSGEKRNTLPVDQAEARPAVTPSGRDTQISTAMQLTRGALAAATWHANRFQSRGARTVVRRWRGSLTRARVLALLLHLVG